MAQPTSGRYAHSRLMRQRGTGSGRPPVISQLAMYLTAITAVAMLGLSLFLFASGGAHASANDTYERAAPIESLPFRDDAIDLLPAGAAPDEPRASCMSPSHTAWYALAPESDMPMTAWVVPDLDGAAALDVALAIWERTPEGLLTEAGCVDDHAAGGPEQLVMTARAETTYYFQVSAVDRLEAGEGTLTFLVDVQRPEHDLFAFARRVGSSPFRDVDVDAIAARREPGEMASSCADLDATTWYGLSSPEDATLEVTVTPSDAADNALDVAVVLHTGRSVESLVETACVDGQGVQGAEHLEAPIYGGEEYWIQIGAVLSEDAGPGVYTLLIDGIQTIDLRPVPDTVLGAAPVEISAEASSGLPVVVEVEGPCRISDGALVANGAGLCSVTASQSGDADWAPAVPVTTTFRVGQGRQTIALEPIIGAVVGEPAVVYAEAESGLPVTFDTSGPCRMVDAVLHADGAGTCTVTASQDGDVDWRPAEPVTTTLRIGRGRQSIEFARLPVTAVGAEPLRLSVTSDSGLSVVLEADGPCALEGRSLRALGAGTCTVTASQDGDADWAPAEPVTTTLRVGRGRQSIEFDAPSDEAVFGDAPLEIDPEASSGLRVAVEVEGPCRLFDGDLVSTGAGTCTITASQDGDVDWRPAEPVTTIIAIAPASQAIELEPLLGDIVFGAPPFDVTVTSESGLPVTLEASGPCLIEGRSLRALGAGTCTVTASQDGDADWAPAEPVTTTLRVGRGRQSIEFDAPSDEAVFGDAPLEIDPEASSGLRVAVEVEGPCRLFDGDLVSTGAGTCTITASQDGDVDWRPAEPVTTIIAIAPASQAIELEHIGRRLLGEGPIELKAASTSGLPLTFSASGPCRADAGVLILLEGGTCTVTASQPGDADWAAAETSASFPIDTPITEPGQDASDIAAVSPPGARVGHGASITSAFESDGPGEHYYAITLDEADVLEVGGIEEDTTWSVAGPMDLASDEVIWRDMEVDVDTAAARWVASETGIHSIRVADLDPESDLRPAYSASVTIESGIHQVVTQGELEAAMLDRLRPIRCQALREDEEPRPFINGALAGVRCRRPAKGVYEVKLFTFPDQEQLRAFHQTRVDEVHPGLQSVANACERGRRGVRDWEHGRVACWIPTGRSRGALHWTDERTNTYGIIRTLVGDNRQLLQSWRALVSQAT